MPSTVETADTVTLVLTPLDKPIADPLPGQFTMVYSFGVGEVPISVSGRTGAGDIVHTLRSVGAVTKALSTAECGATLGLRGPFGTDWGMPDGGDLVIMAGGIGLAPLRPVIRQAIEQRFRVMGNLTEPVLEDRLDVQVFFHSVDAGHIDWATCSVTCRGNLPRAQGRPKTRPTFPSPLH